MKLKDIIPHPDPADVLKKVLETIRTSPLNWSCKSMANPVRIYSIVCSPESLQQTGEGSEVPEGKLRAAEAGG